MQSLVAALQTQKLDYIAVHGVTLFAEKCNNVDTQEFNVKYLIFYAELLKNVSAHVLSCYAPAVALFISQQFPNILAMNQQSPFDAAFSCINLLLSNPEAERSVQRIIAAPICRMIPQVIQRTNSYYASTANQLCAVLINVIHVYPEFVQPFAKQVHAVVIERNMSYFRTILLYILGMATCQQYFEDVTPAIELSKSPILASNKLSKEAKLYIWSCLALTNMHMFSENLFQCYDDTEDIASDDKLQFVCNVRSTRIIALAKCIQHDYNIACKKPHVLAYMFPITSDHACQFAICSAMLNVKCKTSQPEWNRIMNPFFVDILSSYSRRCFLFLNYLTLPYVDICVRCETS